MSHNTHEGIRNLSPISSISLTLLFFYFITLFSFIMRTICTPFVGLSVNYVTEWGEDIELVKWANGPSNPFRIRLI